jgi:thiamine pyrophosphate-dependent acetolactate synthase large subunit-like protein
VAEPEAFTAALARAIAKDGPALIDVVIEGKAK